MLRLMKLAMYALVGYAVYELYQGWSHGGGGGGRARRGARVLKRALNEDQGRYGALTGGGEGETVTSDESSGTSVPHRVGRGVTSS